MLAKDDDGQTAWHLSAQHGYEEILEKIWVWGRKVQITPEDNLLLEVTEMKTLRRIINKTKWDRMRNDRIRELCEIQNITSWEHVSRMADDRLVKKVHDGIPEGKRNRGRPMKRWRDALE